MGKRSTQDSGGVGRPTPSIWLSWATVAQPFYYFVLNMSRSRELRGLDVDLEVIVLLFHGIFVFLLWWAYFAGMESSPLRATLGKAAVGLYVSRENGDRISFGQANGRFFGKIISSLILYIGFMMAGWTSRKQALHDKMAGTLVLRK